MTVGKLRVHVVYQCVRVARDCVDIVMHTPERANI